MGLKLKVNPVTFPISHTSKVLQQATGEGRHPPGEGRHPPGPHPPPLPRALPVCLRVPMVLRAGTHFVFRSS